jgi:hypothetical protein
MIIQLPKVSDFIESYLAIAPRSEAEKPTKQSLPKGKVKKTESLKAKEEITAMSV